MKVEQLSIFLENRAGRLATVTRVLAEANVNIRALSLADTSDFGILRLIVTDTTKAKNVLKDAGFTVGYTDVVAIAVEDKPGGLDHVLQLVTENALNVEYIYAFVPGSTGLATMIFRFEEPDRAITALGQHNVHFLSLADIIG